MSENEPKPLVLAISEMDQDTFRQHMNARHSDSLGGMSELVALPEYEANLYRAFHKRLHETRVDLQHEHQRAADHAHHWQDRL